MRRSRTSTGTARTTRTPSSPRTPGGGALPCRGRQRDRAAQRLDPVRRRRRVRHGRGGRHLDRPAARARPGRGRAADQLQVRGARQRPDPTGLAWPDHGAAAGVSRRSTRRSSVVAFRTALTELFGIRHPILLAPMGAVSRAAPRGRREPGRRPRPDRRGLRRCGVDRAGVRGGRGRRGRHRLHHLASRPPSRSVAGSPGAQAGRGHALVRRSDAVRGADPRCRSAADPAGADARRRARCGPRSAPMSS